jgi:hypothetical protein
MKLQIFNSLLSAMFMIAGATIANGQTLDSIAPQSRPILEPLDASNCYMVTAEGTTIDLSQMCGSNVTSASSPATTVAQSSNNAGTAFSQNGCYVFDSLGRPCSSEN